ncbi:MAG: UDP-glucose 4-epimerase GalE [Firmicutes bacterium]|nr:UDP-glucose 4-epimerase GalE [Bacillota bacterium]
MTILATGGAGYIGSHACVSLLENGYDVVVVDDLSNASAEAVRRVEKITGKELRFYEADVCDRSALERIFSEQKISGVIHFAGMKAVGESVQKPLEYYRNNLDATITILEVMRQFGCRAIVFSSSATVYGSGNKYPYRETMDKGTCSNPYGWTKSMSEQILCDAAKAYPELSVVLLRYFNPIGAHESGLIGEDPKGIPNNLMPYITQVAVGKRKELTVFGGDYDTPDGTCRRDYIHVMDLAEGHVKAIEYALGHSGAEVFNLGTGVPYSVLEIIRAFEDASGIKITYRIGDRREGDLPEFWADASKARDILGWKTRRSLADMCRDSWNWQKNNPKGYEE